MMEPGSEKKSHYADGQVSGDGTLGNEAIDGKCRGLDVLFDFLTGTGGTGRYGRDPVYRYRVQETVSARAAWILSRISHSSIHLGKVFRSRISQSRQGLLTRYPISKSNRCLNRYGLPSCFINRFSFRSEPDRKHRPRGLPRGWQAKSDWQNALLGIFPVACCGEYSMVRQTGLRCRNRSYSIILANALTARSGVS